MLTTTYSFVALSIEQTTARMDLSILLKYVQRRMAQAQAFGRADIHSFLHKINRFHTHCSVRKVERCLVPALRRSTKKADFLLAEIESLGLMGLDLLREIRHKLRMAMAGGSLAISEIYNAIEQYCSVILLKINKEEQELFDMARHMLSQEDWFSLAVQFLSHDAHSAVQTPETELPLPPVAPIQYLSYQAPRARKLGIEIRPPITPALMEIHYHPDMPGASLPRPAGHVLMSSHP